MRSPRRSPGLTARLTAALVSAALLLAGCAAGEAGQGPADQAPRRGGTLTLGTTGEPDSWDVHVSVSSLSALVLRAVHDSLVHQKPDGTFEPWLAKSWQISDDGLRYTFELREDVTFSDGTRFDAEAVKANFDHVVDPATKSRNAKTIIGPYAGTEVAGPFTAVVTFKSPYSPFLAAASTPYLGFHSPKVLADHRGDIASGGEYVVGTGPFVFSSLTAGQEAVFTRRPGYAWAPKSAPNQGEAHLDGYKVQFLSDDAARVGALSSGQLDVADQVPSTRLAELRGQGRVELQDRDNLGAPFTYNLNVTRAPLDEKDVRLAVQAAVDTESITKGLFQGAYNRAWSVLTAPTPGYAKEVEGTWGYDKGRAEKLLSGAGYTATDAEGYRTRDGRRLALDLVYASEFTSKEQLNYHTALKDALKQVGVELVLKPLDTAAVVRAFGGGDYHLGAFSFTSPDGSLLRTAFHSASLPGNGGSNVSRVADPEIDGWLDEALRTGDVAGQQALYGKVQRKVLAEGLVLPTYVGKRVFGIQHRVRGFELDVQNLPTLERVWVS
ncbi:ABC transporter substrate-binding protein [Saccharothrix syringae]|uniref:ABC transporter substrate-binding protein n=1 Tax=Saccharothrix syringae TaxID=103733 RepID=A0A5Q0GZC8_SACSY|nr:ABC transporter substrate-binding protein [Saccharothrix syringae]QFZ19203.1 ABC transporter substrate-binding protein [Saccharothrix syringae]